MSRIPKEERIKIKLEKMHGIELIKKNREYLDYLERHFHNIQEAWDDVHEACKTSDMIWDDFKYWTIHEEIQHHDISKFSKEEYIAYRQKFFPTKKETDEDKIEQQFKEAVSNHVRLNNHHVEHILKNYSLDNPSTSLRTCIYLLAIDWLAMSYEFNNDPCEYYKSKKASINFPPWIEKELLWIFSKVKKYRLDTQLPES